MRKNIVRTLSLLLCAVMLFGMVPGAFAAELTEEETTVVTEAPETEPVTTEPAETEIPETVPAETEAPETEPAETEAPETEPAQTEPAETDTTEPQETAETEPEEIGFEEPVFDAGHIAVAPDGYEYAVFPMDCLNISQGQGEGYTHTDKLVIDNAGFDTGIDGAYAPFSGTIKAKSDWNGGNWVILQSNNLVHYADGSLDYMTLMIAHMDDTSHLYVGQPIAQGQWFYQEGKAGQATGNHVEMGIVKGTYKNWIKLSSGQWILRNQYNIYDGLFLNADTTIYNGYGYNWRKVDGSAVPGVQMKWESASNESTNTNSKISVRAVPSISGTFGNVGVTLFDIDGNAIGGKTEAADPTARTYLDIWYDINGELGVTLVPGTEYLFKFFAEFNGTRFESDMFWLKTTGTAPTVTFNANGGSCGTGSMKAELHGALRSLPEATRSGYTFEGWYTGKFFGDKVTTATKFSSNTTVYAHWTKKEVAVEPVYRLYNPYSNEHLFVTDEGEYDSLGAIGWKQEGVAWNAPKEGDPVYRLFNPYTGGHFYTLSEKERDDCVAAGWREDGVLTHSAPEENGKPIFRLFNPYEKMNPHHYTVDVAERDALVKLGWRYEGTAWYAAK